MQHFSKEYLDRLIAEHKLVSATIAHLKGPALNRMVASHGNDAVAGAVNNLRAKKVELEGQIDVLAEYLN